MDSSYYLHRAEETAAWRRRVGANEAGRFALGMPPTPPPVTPGQMLAAELLGGALQRGWAQSAGWGGPGQIPGGAAPQGWAQCGGWGGGNLPSNAPLMSASVSTSPIWAVFRGLFG